MQEAAHFSAAGQDKRVERLQVFLAGIDEAFETLHLLLADPKHALVGKVRGGGQFTAQVEQFILELAQDIVQMLGGRQLRLQRGNVSSTSRQMLDTFPLQVVIEYPGQAHHGVQLVQRPVGLDTDRVLGDLFSPDEPGRTLITRPSINLGDADHCDSGLTPHPTLSPKGRGKTSRPSRGGRS